MAALVGTAIVAVLPELVKTQEYIAKELDRLGISYKKNKNDSDEIVTIGGIIGTVKERNDDEIVLVVNEDGTTLHLLIYAVQSIRTES